MAPSMIFMIVFDALILLGAVILFLRPSFTLKLLTWILRHTLVRLRVEGLENIPDSGPVLIVSNHVSLIDMLLIQSVSRRPVRFMVHQEVLEFVPTRFIFWYLGVIRVPSIRRPKAMQRFFRRVRGELRKGEVLCLFPEGESPATAGLCVSVPALRRCCRPELTFRSYRSGSACSGAGCFPCMTENSNTALRARCR